MKKTFFVLLLLTGFISAQKLDTLKIDVVEYFKGFEISGLPEIESINHRYVYLFSNKENLKEFEDNIEKYKIQLGGACGRMGPLSGAGRTSIYAIYKGKFYIFASQSCKTTFLQKGDELLEEDDPVPSPPREEIEKGEQLFNKVIAALGGIDRFNLVNTFTEKYEKEIEYNGQNVLIKDIAFYSYPSAFRLNNYWGDSKWSRVLNGEKGVFIEASNNRIMDNTQLHAAKKEFSHHLVHLLKHGNEQIVFYGGKAEFAGLKYDLLNVYSAGTLHKLLIDQKGRPINISYTGRGPGMYIGKIEKYFSDYKNYNGIILPSIISCKFNGEIVPSWTAVISGIEFNSEYSPEFFSPAL